VNFGILEFVALGIAVLLAVVIHEYSHGYIAYRLGDPTAKMNGRLTLNPISHLDPLGTLAFVITQRFGWAKPVPINPRYFENPLKGMALVGLAGPASDLLMAFLGGLVFRFGLAPNVSLINTFFDIFIQINIGLAIFNLIPIPPLDGSRILLGILPEDKAIAFTKMEMYGLFILLFILIFTPQLINLLLLPPFFFIYRLFIGG
jgi:Zn-dependent protease